MSRLQFKYDPTYINIYSQIRSYCKGAVQEVKEEVKVKVNSRREQPTKSITTITDELVNTHVKENPEIVTNHLRNERVMKTQRNK